MNEIKIILMDRDNYNSVIGLLTVKGHTEEEVQDVFDDITEELPGEWSVEDFIEKLSELGWSFSWEEDVSSWAI